MKMSYTRVVGLFLLACSALVSCKETGGLPPVTEKHRTVIEYMVADNNLYSYAVEDINEMESAWSTTYDGHMVVFLYPVSSTSVYVPSDQREGYDDRPRLLLIDRDADESRINSRVLKYYDRAIDPCDPTVMSQVLADAMTLAPAENYALIYWSHGSGWLPDGTYQPLKSTLLAVGDVAWAGSKLEGMVPENPQGVTSYSFGVSNSNGGSEMEIDAMAAALPTGTVFDFILFDACHMACVELAWELKDHTDYLIASAAETLADGFPYKTMMELMYTPQVDVAAIGRDFYDYYNVQSGAWRSATVGVVRSDKLPALAESVKALCDAGLPAEGISYAGQQYGRQSKLFQNTFYDLADFVRRTWGESDPLVTAFDAALNDAVVYQAATPWLFKGYSGAIHVNTHCGLSCYLPRTSTPLSLEAYRSRFGWSTASGMGALVP